MPAALEFSCPFQNYPAALLHFPKESGYVIWDMNMTWTSPLSMQLHLWDLIIWFLHVSLLPQLYFQASIVVPQSQTSNDFSKYKGKSSSSKSSPTIRKDKTKNAKNASRFLATCVLFRNWAARMDGCHFSLSNSSKKTVSITIHSDDTVGRSCACYCQRSTKAEATS